MPFSTGAYRTMDPAADETMTDQNASNGMALSWTDERVELLRKLWDEGLSASRIAGRARRRRDAQCGDRQGAPPRPLRPRQATGLDGIRSGSPEDAGGTPAGTAAPDDADARQHRARDTGTPCPDAGVARRRQRRADGRERHHHGPARVDVPLAPSATLLRPSSAIAAARRRSARGRTAPTTAAWPTSRFRIAGSAGAPEALDSNSVGVALGADVGLANAGTPDPRRDRCVRRRARARPGARRRARQERRDLRAARHARQDGARRAQGARRRDQRAEGQGRRRLRGAPRNAARGSAGGPARCRGGRRHAARAPEPARDRPHPPDHPGARRDRRHLRRHGVLDRRRTGHRERRLQFHQAEFSAGPSRAGHARHVFLPGRPRRQPQAAAHAHEPGAGAHDAGAKAADPRHLSRPHLPLRFRPDAHADVPPGRGPRDRPLGRSRQSEVGAGGVS